MSYHKKSQKKIKKTSTRRLNRVRGAQSSRGVIPRVSVFRSLKQISAQIIDDSNGATLACFSSSSIKEKGLDKTTIAKKVGVELGKIALEKSIDKAFFDRGKYLYHGRVAALAAGLRESGLQL